MKRTSGPQASCFLLHTSFAFSIILRLPHHSTAKLNTYQLLSDYVKQNNRIYVVIDIATLSVYFRAE